MNALLLGHLFCTFGLTGLIWLVQTVHYPAFFFVPKERFAEFAQFHANRITWIVAPLMVIELGTCGWIFLAGPSAFWGAQLCAILLIWACTGFLSVPCHAQLQRIRSDAEIRRLVITNWPRTLLWTFRSVSLAWLVLH